MLNELYELSLSLEKAGILTEEWHKNLQEVKKTREPKVNVSSVGNSEIRTTGKNKQAQGTPAFMVCINHEGDVTEIEQVGQARLDGVRYWQTANGVSFPCFNVRPLFKIYKGAGASKDEQDVFSKWLKSIAKSGIFSEQDDMVLRGYLLPENELWDDSQKKRLTKCLVNAPMQLLQVVEQPPDEYKAIKEIINRAVKMTPQRLFTQLISKIIDKIHRVSSNVEDLLRFLLYAGNMTPGNSILIALELNDGLSNFKNPALNRKTIAWINKQLLSSDTKRHAVQSHRSDDKDAFGLPVAGWDEKYGGLRKIGIFGDVILRSMSKDSPCQYRYRAADFNSFIAGSEFRKKAKGALQWLTALERKDKTWGNVSFARDDEEILLVYPSELPTVPIAAVAMFGGAPTNSATQSARFVNYAEDVTKALHSIARPLKEVEMRVFALRKMDKARTQVSCHRNYSAERLIAAAAEWQTSSGNVPNIQIRQWGKEKGSKPEWQPLEVPFPLEVIWCLNTPWPKAADDAKKRVREFSSSDGVALLLDDGVQLKPLLERILHVAIRNGGNLLMAMAHTQHQGGVHKVNGKYDKQKLLLPTVLGLLLAKLECKRENYMKTAPYLIGRMLSLADQIHFHYCQQVRNGSSPSQLIGNALMTTALEEPEKALALGAQRILPYQAWARTTSGDGAGLAKFFLAELGKACSEIALVDVPRRCADTDKAQMLLGYLAMIEKTDSTNTPAQL